MEAQQCVELTSTNRPFGLIIKLTQTVDRFQKRLGEFAKAARLRLGKSRAKKRVAIYSLFDMSQTCMPANFSLSSRELWSTRARVSGGHIARVTPVPIPNTVVKPR